MTRSGRKESHEPLRSRAIRHHNEPLPVRLPVEICSCWDNAVAESFFATLEHELLEGADFHSHREAHTALAEFIDGWYNPERMHSTLEYRSPMQYEQQLRQMARAD